MSQQRTRSLSRARRMAPNVANLIDVLAVAERRGDDPEQVAHDLWVASVTEASVRRALAALVVSHVISGLSEWPGDVRGAVKWAYAHNASPLTPLPGTEEA